jgi:hypothetical protein
MGNKALREWAKEDIKPHQKRGNGRISALARHLGISQPAVTKIIDGSSLIKLKYVNGIIEFTGISAKDLLPEYYELFSEDFKGIEYKLKSNIDLIKELSIKQLEDSIEQIKEI